MSKPDIALARETIQRVASQLTNEFNALPEFANVEDPYEPSVQAGWSGKARALESAMVHLGDADAALAPLTLPGREYLVEEWRPDGMPVTSETVDEDDAPSSRYGVLIALAAREAAGSVTVCYENGRRVRIQRAR